MTSVSIYVLVATRQDKYPIRVLDLFVRRPWQRPDMSNDLRKIGPGENIVYERIHRRIIATRGDPFDEWAF